VYSRIVIYFLSVHQWQGAAAAAILLAGAVPAPSAAQWRFSPSPTATAWYGVLDSLHLAGHGALPLTRAPGTPVAPLARTLAADRFDVIHFAPLYYPSASPVALADALEDAAGTAEPRAVRARFLVGALRAALPDAADRQHVASLASALRRAVPVGVEAEQLAAWQSAWDRRFASPLAPFLARDRLDSGVIWIVPSLGPEGRLFAGVPADRHDNLIAISTPVGADDADGPLFAAVREICFPLVSRTADRVALARRAGGTTQAARRASFAAVRCGAALLDAVAPAEAAAYRAHWQRVGGGGAFDALYPTDALLSAPVQAALTALQRTK